jgi:putative ABC transport system permease protein
VRPDNPSAPFSLPEFMDYRDQARTLAGIAAYANWSASLAGEGVTERLQGARMSANSFAVLGVSPAAGRLLQEADDRPDAPHVAVVSYRLWQRQLGGAKDAVGRAVRINGESFVIVGVLPAQFPLPLRDLDVVAPLVPAGDPSRHIRNSVNFLRVFGRLRPGVTAAQAQQELTSICRSLRQQFPVEYARKEAVHTTALRDALIGDHRPLMLLLLASVAVVLGTALANLLCLALVRANERRAEMSIRIALGASPPHLVRQLVAEGMVLTLLGGGLGCVLAAWATSTVVVWAPSSIPRLGEIVFDGRALAFATALTFAATLLLSVAPIGAALRARARDALRLASRGALGDRWNHHVRNVLVVGEISAALVLLLATTLLVQGLLRLQRVHPGFRPDSVFQARVSLPPTYRSPEELARFYETLSQRLAALPGVRDVGLISAAPMSGLLATVPFAVAGQPPATARQMPAANLRVITPGYLAAVGTRLLRGRPLSERDESGGLAVALVSEALAEKFLVRDGLGQQLLIDDNNKGPRPVEVVGVVENVRQAALDGPPTLDVYLPLRQIHPDGVAFLRNNQFWMVKTDTDPAAFRVRFLAELRAVDPDAAISSTGTMRQYLEEWLAPRRFSLTLFVAFSLTAVLLAVSGLYGLVSYTVSQRQREIGLRMAIGATEGDVQRLILRRAARLGLVGAVVGLSAAGASRPLVSRMAGDVSLDPVLAVATTGVLLAVTLMAGWLPARRAARTDPTLALRGE